MPELDVPQGTYRLERWPTGGDPTLRAWDAADEMALQHLDEHGVSGRTLVVNDAFGALTVALRGGAIGSRDVVTWGDSSLSNQGVVRNLDRNELDGNKVQWIDGDQVPEGPFAVVIVKIPRNLSLLEHQLRQLRPLLADHATVVGAGMVKHIHNSTIALFEQFLGPSPTSRAHRKARLILPTIDRTLPAPPPGELLNWEHDGLTIANHAGVFSRTHLDQGTRVLFAHLPKLSVGDRVLDLGCGNGIVGAKAVTFGCEVVFTDDSALAIASARKTMELSHPGVDATYLITDAADGVPDNSVDIVLCNPPFHAQGARVTDVAWRMVAAAYRVLRPGGTLTLVGNRQLDHHLRCQRVFGNSQVISSHPKFAVVRSTR